MADGFFSFSALPVCVNAGEGEVMLLSWFEEVLLQTDNFKTPSVLPSTHTSCSYRPFIPRRNLWSRRDMLECGFAHRSGEIHPAGVRLLAASVHSQSRHVFCSECKQAFLFLRGFLCVQFLSLVISG